jgi:hypothetical protein
MTTSFPNRITTAILPRIITTALHANVVSEAPVHATSIWHRMCTSRARSSAHYAAVTLKHFPPSPRTWRAVSARDSRGIATIWCAGSVAGSIRWAPTTPLLVPLSSTVDPINYLLTLVGIMAVAVATMQRDGWVSWIDATRTAIRPTFARHVRNCASSTAFHSFEVT